MKHIKIFESDREATFARLFGSGAIPRCFIALIGKVRLDLTDAAKKIGNRELLQLTKSMSLWSATPSQETDLQALFDEYWTVSARHSGTDADTALDGTNNDFADLEALLDHRRAPRNPFAGLTIDLVRSFDTAEPGVVLGNPKCDRDLIQIERQLIGKQKILVRSFLWGWGRWKGDNERLNNVTWEHPCYYVPEDLGKIACFLADACQ